MSMKMASASPPSLVARFAAFEIEVTTASDVDPTREVSGGRYWRGLLCEDERGQKQQRYCAETQRLD
jgi:hypothetical protein